MESAVKSWHETSAVEARAYFLLDKDKTDSEKYAPVVNVDKVFKLLVHVMHPCSCLIIFLHNYLKSVFSFGDGLQHNKF